MIQIYNSKGDNVAYIDNSGSLYDLYGRPLGQLKVDKVHDVKGNYLGDLKGNLILRKKNLTRVVSRFPSISVTNSIKRIKSVKRTKTLISAEYESIFG